MNPKNYRVAVFIHERKNRKPLYLAYLRDFNESWNGCNIVNTVASSGKEAKNKQKKQAINFIKIILAVQDGESETDSWDSLVYNMNDMYRYTKIKVVKDGD